MTAAPAVRKATILLVDDRRENLVTLEAVLNPLGQRLVTARSGEEALKVLLNEEVAVILLDVQMPGMDGFETAAHIRRRERTRHIPIIFLTAIHSDAHNVLRGYSTGAVDYIAKPFDAWVLRSKVAVFVELDLKNDLLQRQAALLRQRLAERQRAEHLLEQANLELERRAEELERSNLELAELADAARAANRAKGAFLNMAAHELRTPLAVINGYVSLVLAGAYGTVAESLQKPLSLVEQKAEELGMLIDGILTAARLDAGSLPTSPERVDMVELVREAVQRAGPRALLVGADLTAVVPDMATFVRADAAQVHRILDNLINNAFNYGGATPWVEVRLECANGAVRTLVSDRGVGIAPDLHEQIFERFVRAGDAGLGFPGTGLGLFISRELAERNGGWLRLEYSALGEGSRFALSLPVDPAH